MQVKRIGEVAQLTGVSIRTLHHYDRTGLVKPLRRSEGGHRLYSDDELLRLQQVLTLRYLGFSLKRIGTLLDGAEFDLVASLRTQREALRDRRAEINNIENLLSELLVERVSTGAWNWSLVANATRAVQAQMKRKDADMERYYTPEQMAQFAELRERTPEDEIRTLEADWASLLDDVRAGVLLPADSMEALQLLRRWDAMTERTRLAYEGYAELATAIGENYQAGNFDSDPRAPSREDFAFIERIRAAANHAETETGDEPST